MTRLRYLSLIVVPVGLLLVALPGCGEKTARVSGKVTYKDKAVPGGTVLFAAENGKVESTSIKPDGSYESALVPYGNLRVAVMPAAKSSIALMPKGGKPPPIPADSPAAKNYESTGTYVDIPPALRDPATSKITLTVDKADVPFNIELKDVK